MAGRLTKGQLRRRRKRAARKAARQAARRARWLARWRKIVNEVAGAKIIATTRENPPPTRVKVGKRPLVMHQVYADTGERMTTEQYRATFAGDGRRTELEFELDPDSGKEIRAAAYEAAELAHGPTTRGWHLIKVEGVNALGKEMLK